jgi:hypothetical protein
VATSVVTLPEEERDKHRSKDFLLQDYSCEEASVIQVLIHYESLEVKKSRDRSKSEESHVRHPMVKSQHLQESDVLRIFGSVPECSSTAKERDELLLGSASRSIHTCEHPQS